MTQIKTIDSTVFRSNFKSTFDMVKKSKKPLIIKQRNVPSFVLVDIDEYEDYLDSINKDLQKHVKEAREQIKKGQVFLFEDVFENIK